MPSRSRNTRALLTPILLASLLATSAVGCGDDEGAASADEVRSTVARATPGAGRADPVLADASGDDNFTYSPLSITTALGMARAGATGPSADQLDELLGTSADHPAADALNALDQLLITRSGARKNDSGEDAELTLSAANSLWGQRDATWKAPFLDTLKRSYGVGIHTVDYVGDAEGARRAVNGWVAEQTHDQEFRRPGAGRTPPEHRIPCGESARGPAQDGRPVDRRALQPRGKATGVFCVAGRVRSA